MNLLLDTQVFLWFCQGSAALSQTARDLIENANHRKLLSLASCWEIAIKAGLGKLHLGEPSVTYLLHALARSGIELYQSRLSMLRQLNNFLRIIKTRSIACCLCQPKPVTCAWLAVM